MLCVTCPNRANGFCGTLSDLLSQPSTASYSDTSHQFVTFRPGEFITRRHEVSQRILIVCGGWVFRHFELPKDRRQILRFLLPGDLVSIGPIVDKNQYSTTALTEVQLSSFDRQDLIAGCMASPEFADAVARAGIEEIRSASELSVILGQRSAEERIAYLFLDLTRRIAARAVIRDHRYALPLRQQHIADAVGLTAVHVSRVLGAFRDRRVCDLSEGVLSVLNPAELERIGGIG